MEDGGRSEDLKRGSRVGEGRQGGRRGYGGGEGKEESQR